ncbi:MAG: indole-3-glycerol phosphate synthase TrpC [Candidatus Omnitrophica bacterium]|nr:indole-3-glycerol phosphate synthase TrpC [Candidatus Omnitrophota bacterium]
MSKEILDEIVAYKRTVVESKKEIFQRLKEKISGTSYSRYSIFKQRISQSGRVNLIAEVKKASPSRGLLRDEFDPLAIGRIYDECSVAAMSVLTEDKYFKGRMDYLRKISEQFSTPVLQKDFIIDEGQIYEARTFGASAILLIVSILSDHQIKHFYQLATALDLDCLVEIHNQEELKRALACDVEIIGINNRNLKTFEVDIKHCAQLIPMIPKNKIIVAESGIKNHEDVTFLKNAGVHAVLIGETFMQAEDIKRKIYEVMGEEISNGKTKS